VAYHMPAIHSYCQHAIHGDQVPVAGTRYTTFPLIRALVNGSECVSRVQLRQPDTVEVISQATKETMKVVRLATVPVRTPLHWSTELPTGMGRMRRNDQCCGWEAQCGQQTKSNWTKTTHCTHAHNSALMMN